MARRSDKTTSRKARTTGARRPHASASATSEKRASSGAGGRTRSGSGSKATRRGGGKSPARGGRLHARWGRVGVVILVLVAAGLYYGPLKDFFTQQDQYRDEKVALAELKAENKDLERQIAAMKGRSWIEREARAQFQLVPKGAQAFVITGLPGPDEAPEPVLEKPRQQSFSWVDRLRDLWDTLLR